MTTLRPYDVYKPSGIEWLGDLPTHWSTVRTKFVFNERVEKGYPHEPLLAATQTLGVVRKDRYENRTVVATKDLELLKLVLPGDFVISLRSFQGGIEVAWDRGIISPAYTVLTPTNSETTGYLRWLLKSQPYIENLGLNVTGIREGQNINYDSLSRSALPCPPLDEQRAITNFLDTMDGRITRFIDARRRMIALLEEQKQAIINQAVTRGLDPDMPMKPSGIDWLGDIPAHWEVRRLRDCISSSMAGVWGDDPTAENSEDHIWCIRVADFDMETLRITDEKKTMRAISTSAQKPRILEGGDILLEKSGGGENQPVGRAVMFDWNEDAVTSNFVTRLRPNRQLVEPAYLLAFLEALQAARVTQLSIKQTTGIQNLDERHYLSNFIPLPHLKEQRQAIDHINTQSAKIESVKSRTLREINLLMEYRTRLISDVVTGKLDVRASTTPQ